MSNIEPNAQITADWLLRRVPFISFCCENDALYTMQYIAFGGGHAFGYNLDDFVQNKHYFAASTTHPEDEEIVDSHAEQAAAGSVPVVSRYRLVQADGEPVPVLLSSRAIFNPDGEAIALAGISLDLRSFPALQGPWGGAVRIARANAPAQPNQRDAQRRGRCRRATSGQHVHGRGR